MALTVDYTYQFSKRLIKKNQAGGLSSTDFAFHWNDAQNSYASDLLGRFQLRSYGKTGTNTGLIENQTILQKLAAFTVPVTLTIVGGNADKPDGFSYRLALRVSGVDAIKITHGQIASVTGSVIDPPSVTDNAYYYVEYEDYYSFFPNTITSASLDCINYPENVVWGYVWDENGRQVYNSGTSVQPKWGNAECMEITKRMLDTIGVSYKDRDFENFGQKIIATGG